MSCPVEMDIARHCSDPFLDADDIGGLIDDLRKRKIIFLRGGETLEWSNVLVDFYASCFNGENQGIFEALVDDEESKAGQAFHSLLDAHIEQMIWELTE